MFVINIALIILGILYGVGSVTNFKEWYYRHDYLAIMLSVFTSILLVVAGILNVLNWKNRCADWRCLNVIELTAKHRVQGDGNALVKWVSPTNSPLQLEI